MTLEHAALAIAVAILVVKLFSSGTITSFFSWMFKVGEKAVLPAPVQVALKATEAVVGETEALLSKIPLTDIVHHTLARLAAVEADRVKAEQAALALAKLKSVIPTTPPPNPTPAVVPAVTTGPTA